jgi:hypothetical protein
VVIEGTQQQIATAAKLIDRILNPAFDEIDCSKVAVSHVIGPNGRTMAEITS